jgi:tetratricopeptide (TPR) repeat protein
VIARRLGHLSGECSQVLALASVLGREFELDVLVRMSGSGEDELIAALDEATEARILSNGLRFAHVLIRDVLYEGMTAPRRARLHRLAAETLEQLHGEESLAELAYHAVAGHDFDKALEWGRRAGDRALELLAYEEAARLYGVALDAHPDERMRCALLLARGEAEMRGGNTDTAKETFRAAADIARRLGLSHELARAADGYGGRIVWVRAGDDERLVPLLEEALAVLGEDELELRCRLLARLAGALRDEPSRDRREALSRTAVELARAADKQRALAYALDAHGYAILGPDTADRCLVLAHELGAAAAAAGDIERVVASHMLAAMSLIVLGDIPQLEREIEAGLRRATELKQAAQLAQAHGVRALLMLSQGWLAEGEALVDERFELGREALPRVSLSIHRCQRHMLCDLRGDLAAVEQEIAELVPMFVARPVLRCVLAHVHARIGRVGEARRALHELPAILPFDQEWLYGMSLLAETAVLLDDEEAVPTLYEALSPWCELNAADVAEGCRGAVSRYLGLLATALGREDDAAAHFERALQLNERMGFRPWLARTQDDYAGLLRRRGEVAKAEALEAAALATYDEVGMVAARLTPG